jgi:hypothetical protein
MPVEVADVEAIAAKRLKKDEEEEDDEEEDPASARSCANEDLAGMTILYLDKISCF